MKSFPPSVVLFAATICTALSVDRTVEQGASGADVVLATIAKIESSGVFNSDKRILRRIAYVETRDGAASPPNGGIWNASQEPFEETQQNSLLSQLKLQINVAFSTELTQSNVNSYESLQWEDLRQPLWSALAARLTLFVIESTIERLPTSSDVSRQATFWSRYYGTEGNAKKFIADVQQLEMDEGCNIKSDVIFVLDSSGSIGESNYQEVKRFAYNFVNELEIGPTENQVGVVIYSGYGQTEFYLNTYSRKSDILEAIDGIYYTGGSTNTADGLCLMLRGFSEEHGARLSESNVFRLAIVMTDGHSGGRSRACGFRSTLGVAQMVHNFTRPIVTFAIGVTGNVNSQELEAIASKREYVTYLASFGEAVFRETRDEQTYELCEKTTIPVEFGVQNGTLSKNGRVRYELKVPQDGVTVKLCVNGSIVYYASYAVPNPNGALSDYTQTVTGTDACNAAYVRPVSTQQQSPTQQPGDQASIDGGSSGNTNATLYLSLEGVQERNQFVMETLRGDHTEKDQPQDWLVVVVATMITVGIVLLVAFIVVLLVVFYVWRRKQMQKD